MSVTDHWTKISPKTTETTEHINLYNNGYRRYILTNDCVYYFSSSKARVGRLTKDGIFEYMGCPNLPEYSSKENLLSELDRWFTTSKVRVGPNPTLPMSTKQS